MMDYILKLVPYRFIDTIAYTLSFYATLNDIYAFELFQMLWYGGLSQSQLVN